MGGVQSFDVDIRASTKSLKVFFSNLKKEKIQSRVSKGLAEANQEVFHYIEMFYNPRRLHTLNRQ